MVNNIFKSLPPKNIQFKLFLFLSFLLYFISVPFLRGFYIAEHQSLKDILMAIHKEVLELGKRENEDFIKREFHIDLDKDPYQQEEHIVVLSQTLCERDFMTIQITYFKSRDNITKYPKDMKKISCYIHENELEIKESSYSEKEGKRLFSDILEGIRIEKKLLKLIDLY